MKYSTLLLCLLGLAVGVWSQCVQDYECGNVPYTICDGGVNDCSSTVPGIGVDTAHDTIYFAQICRVDFDHFPNITFKKISGTGGVPTQVQTRKQIPAAVNGFFYYSIQSRSPGQILSALELSTLIETTNIDTQGFFQNILELDSANDRSFAGNLIFTSTSYHYEITGFDGVLAPGVGPLPNTTLYTIEIPSILTAVRASGSDLYFSVATPDSNYTVYNSTLYKGSVDGSVSAQALFTVSNTRIQDFDISSGRVYYGTTSAVYSSKLDGTDKKYVSWGSGATGVRVLGSRVYWNSGVAILSDALAGDDVQQVNAFNGHCRCRNGFTGTNCLSCAGQLQWYEGIPSCIAVDSNGVPESCNYDYECPYSPYSTCLGTCECRTGLSGDNCQQCTNSTQTINWVAGLPVCQ